MPSVEGLEAARELARRYLDQTIQPRSEHALELAPGGDEFPTCWILAYNTAEFLATREHRFALAGNGPIIVNRRTGLVRSGVSGRPLEDQLDES
jgi:hypothetical protein